MKIAPSFRPRRTLRWPASRGLLAVASAACIVLADASRLQAQNQGPSSSAAPYLLPVPNELFNVETFSVLTTGDSVPLTGGTAGQTYRLAGIPDGTGAFDNGDGTFTVLINHEIGSNASGLLGVPRAHGQAGAFVSSFVINKTTLQVQSGRDLIQQVATFNPATNSFNPTGPATTPFLRFCSADLPAVSAFFNPATGLGTPSRIFMTGEETGPEGRAFGIVVNTRTAYELPRLGKFSWENSVANPASGDRTIVVGTDDATPGQVYVYVGTKTSGGNEVDRAGLTNGTLYGVAVSGAPVESRAVGIDATADNLDAGRFTLANLGDVSTVTGAQLQTNSAAAGVTEFLRPEDGAWNPDNPREFYFVTTDRFNTNEDAGTPAGQDGRTRLWRLTFDNLADPVSGGTIEMLIEGTGPGQMFDNMTVSGGQVFLQEDPGGQNYLARIRVFDIASRALSEVATHDPAALRPGRAVFLTIDEEASGIIDVTTILGSTRGERSFLFDDQVHLASADPEPVEGGELLLMRVTPRFFTGETALSNNVFYLTFPSGDFFGFYSYAFFPFLYHFDLGFEYFFDAANGAGGVYLYDFASSTFW